ncbi:hypothetical protein PC116_g27676 [Phytophthora cactorum]|nr:hypothetical protein PC111_g24929 [Phytophthora cactorum]KAG4223862.1 hypothetical protein PC116_g27676 [Phytophthora cactorum]
MAAPLPPVSGLHVHLHVPQHVTVRQPLVVVRHAKLQRLGGCAGGGVGGRGLQLEAEGAEVALDVYPQRPNVAVAALGRRMLRRPKLAVEEPLA